MSKFRRLLGAAVCGLAIGATAHAADEFQSRESIRDAVQEFLEAETAGGARAPEVSVGELDSRLRLAACDEPLETFLPIGGRVLGNVTVGVSCAAPKPWKLYVQAKVQLMAPVLVTTVPLRRGAQVGPGDVILEERDLARLTNGYFDDPAALQGMSMRRSVRAGTPVDPAMVEAPKVIRRGDRVAIVAAGSGLEVTMEGEALANGAEGDVIQVRNRSSKRVVEGIVTGPGLVEVRF